MANSGKTIGFWGMPNVLDKQKKRTTPSDTGRRGLGRCCRSLLRKAAACAWESGRSPGTEGSHGCDRQGLNAWAAAKNIQAEKGTPFPWYPMVPSFFGIYKGFFLVLSGQNPDQDISDCPSCN